MPRPLQLNETAPFAVKADPERDEEAAAAPAVEALGAKCK